MFQLKRTTSDNEDFKFLVRLLDQELLLRDGKDYEFFAQFNTLENIRYVVVAYENNQPAGCGAIKSFTSNSMEIKRMFVAPSFRGKGIAQSILSELENWSLDLGSKTCVLETGERQFEAVNLYHKCGYRVIPNFGPYVQVKTSICFEKNYWTYN